MIPPDGLPASWPMRHWLAKVPDSAPKRAILARLQEIAKRAGKADTDAVLAFAHLLNEIDFRKATLSRRRYIEQLQHSRSVAVYLNDQKYAPFAENDDWLASIIRETSERLIRNSSENKAIDSARGTKFADLQPFEKQAFDIIRGKARARAPSNAQSGEISRRPPAAIRVANAVRGDWLQRRRKMRHPADVCPEVR